MSDPNLINLAALEAEDEDDCALAAAIYVAGTAVACAAYRVPGVFETGNLSQPSSGVIGRTMLGEPYRGRRQVKVRSYHMRLTQYAVVAVCGRAAMLALLGHAIGSEHDAIDAAVFIEARARRSVRKAECERIVDAELRPRAARLIREKHEQVLAVACALVRHGTLTTGDVRTIVYPPTSKPH